MSIHDLVFNTTLDSERIFDPLQVTESLVTNVTVTNFGAEDLTDLGLYVVPSTSVGDVDNPADYPPETDFQDLLEWGTSTHLGLTAFGGLEVTVPQNSGSSTTYIRRDKGSNLATKIEFQDLAAGASATFSLNLETPPAVSTRRLFINIVVE